MAGVSKHINNKLISLSSLEKANIICDFFNHNEQKTKKSKLNNKSKNSLVHNNNKITVRPTKKTPSSLKKVVPERFVKNIQNNKNVADLVLTEFLKPGIIRAWAVKSYDRNKPAFVNELVKAVKGNDARIDEIGMNAMTYL